MIQTVSSIQEFYDFVGLAKKPINEQFDVLTHQETYPSTHQMVTAHRRAFFSIIFLESQQEGEMQINQDIHAQLTDVLFFQSPEHVFSFIRGNSMKGFLVFFTPEFLHPHATDIIGEYPFFSSLQNNLFRLNPVEKKEYVQLFKNIITEKDRVETVRYLLLALLEKSKMLWQTQLDVEKNVPRELQLVTDFKRLINSYFIEYRAVEFYADQLNLTPNYLNSQVKSHTGKTAKEHIAERLLLEAKNMLLHTTLTVAEIAFTLNFSEPSYFGKFFKKHTQMTPKQFRTKR